MKKMFTLRGVSGCGKSTKVKDLASWVLSNYPHTINHGVNLTLGDIVGVLQINKLKIGFVSCGDDYNCIIHNDNLVVQHPDLDILVNACRTKGITRQHLEQNYNFPNGWLVKNIYVQRFYPSNPQLETSRDLLIINELKAWLTGLEKL
ncbi:hypothetical protein D3C87_529210 [compost metagenome]